MSEERLSLGEDALAEKMAGSGINGFWRGVRYLSDKMKVVGAVCMVGMTLLTCADVIGRYFRHPIFGSVELVSFMGALCIAMGLPHAQETNSHIGMEMIVQKLPEKVRTVIDTLIGILCFIMFGVATWQVFKYAHDIQKSGEVSMNLSFPVYLIIYVTALCFVIFTLTILRQILDNIAKLRKI